MAVLRYTSVHSNRIVNHSNKLKQPDYKIANGPTPCGNFIYCMALKFYSNKILWFASKSLFYKKLMDFNTTKPSFMLDVMAIL